MKASDNVRNELGAERRAGAIGFHITRGYAAVADELTQSSLSRWLRGF